MWADGLGSAVDADTTAGVLRVRPIQHQRSVVTVASIASDLRTPLAADLRPLFEAEAIHTALATAACALQTRIMLRKRRLEDGGIDVETRLIGPAVFLVRRVGCT